jgi:drug/metabolite transporter (DMT)-like permease
MRRGLIFVLLLAVILIYPYHTIGLHQTRRRQRRWQLAVGRLFVVIVVILLGLALEHGFVQHVPNLPVDARQRGGPIHVG